ncbi:dUTP diphosphatase [Inconstantimicrobium mannanitabidum]|uniref:Deoxyuridine 5'-triphosphate nucleotidohydrolase YncF n=1 Tax=Inconstantimicrobium mannanitabidum TaxID=1604901 RepID=A0ACB5RCI7_9CLOT|nr:deoxyuridine 5'-triphosphate nucleotidohydrolase [Clostridium sp. TW13]GKX66982.1 putative deoxyuridine 5'-triphosphate nucleotidohydrolase YncF [Clostridium sp. TW13]
MKIRVKYFEGATKLKKIQKGNWIDVYANKDVFVKVGEREMIPLGFALELPQGWEAHLAPRSSTFKTWGIIQTNSVGVVDDTYIGDNDQWHMPIYCLQGKHEEALAEPQNRSLDQKEEGTWIRKGDKIGQFRIMEVMPDIEFEEVESFGNVDRGGFGSTGVK